MPLTLPVVPRVTLSRDRHGVIEGVRLTYDSSHTGDPIDGLFRPEPRFMTYFSVLETAGNGDGFRYYAFGRAVRLGDIQEVSIGQVRVQVAAAMDGGGEFQGIAARWTTKDATYQAWLFSPQVPADEATSDMLRMIGSMVR